MSDSESEVERWTHAAAAGDRSALDALLVHYLPQLRAFVRLRADEALRARESSSDLVQSICRDVLRKAENFRHADAESFRRWLFTTALRKILDRRDHHLAGRRDVRKEVGRGATGEHAALLEAYSGVLTPSRAVEAREELARVERAMDALTEEQREVITLSRVVGLSHAAIAREMGKQEGAVRMLLHRALARLVAEVERSDA